MLPRTPYIKPTFKLILESAGFNIFPQNIERESILTPMETVPENLINRDALERLRTTWAGAAKGDYSGTFDNSGS